MKLKAVVDKLDDVAEQYRSAYAEGEDGKFHLTEVEIEDVGGLKSALEKERNDRKGLAGTLKQLKDQYAGFEGLDLDGIKNLLAKIEGDEDAQLIKQGQFDKVIDKRLSLAKQAFEKEKTSLLDKVKIEQEEKGKWLGKVLDSQLRTAAANAGLHASAIEDAVFRGRTMFTLDGEGNAVVFEGDAPKRGKDGLSPFSPSEWLDGMREKAPHWFPASASGSGAQGSSGQGSRSGSQSGTKTIKRADFDALSPIEKSKVASTPGIQFVD